MDQSSDQTAFVYTNYIMATPERVWQGLTDPALTGYPPVSDAERIAPPGPAVPASRPRARPSRSASRNTNSSVAGYARL
jgi:hypothetical protein